MTRGRKPNPTPEQPDVQLNGEALAEDTAALNEIGARSRDIAERYGDGLPYDRARVISEARFYLGQSAEAMLEAGKRLIQLKENEEHGYWQNICEEQLKLSHVTARKMMQAAARYLSPALLEKRQAPAVLALGRAKLLELLAEPEELVEELADGGTLAGHTIEEIDAMTRSELRAALKAEREARAKDAKAKQAVIDKKQQRLDVLEEQLARRESAEPAEQEQAQLDAVRDAGTEAEVAIRHLVGQAAAVLQQPASESTAAAARLAVEYVAQVFAQLITEASVPVDFNEMVTPHWMAATPPTKTKKR